MAGEVAVVQWVFQLFFSYTIRCIKMRDRVAFMGNTVYKTKPYKEKDIKMLLSQQSWLWTFCYSYCETKDETHT